MKLFFLISFFLSLISLFLGCSEPPQVTVVSDSVVGEGWSGTQVNTAIFRSGALCSADSGGVTLQYAAYYNQAAHLCLARRQLPDTSWRVVDTGIEVNARDGHNVCSIATDDKGYLHVSYNHHNAPLHYRRSVHPYGLQLGEELPMTGLQEERVTYPQFVSLTTGQLLFAYRSGQSGCGNMVLNAYNTSTATWEQRQDNLLDGEEQRSPYWELAAGPGGTLLLAWCWRETWHVETNHDKLFALSMDGGRSWQRSDGRQYKLPITRYHAEVAAAIGQERDLMNQTSIASDAQGNAVLATYYTEPRDSIPAIHAICHTGTGWRSDLVCHTTQPFHLAGGGTKMIPFSRPKVVVRGQTALIIFRDGPRLLYALNPDVRHHGQWTVDTLLDEDLGAYEPMIDEQLWTHRGILNLAVQHTFQGDGEVPLDREPTPFRVLEIRVKS